MKVLKGFFLGIIIFILTYLLIFFQINYALKSSFLSGDYFNKNFDDSEITVFVTDYISSQIIGTNFQNEGRSDGGQQDNNESMMPDVGGTLMKYLDLEWLSEQIQSIAKGLYSYIVADADKLPSLDIKPLKDVFMNVLITEMTQRDEVKQNLADVENILEMMDNLSEEYNIKDNLNDEVIDQIMENKEIRSLGFDRDIIKTMLEVWVESEDKEMDASDLVDQMITEVITEQINFDNMKDSVDLNYLMQQIYGNEGNPLSSVRNIIEIYKSRVTPILLTIIILLVLIILTVSFKAKSFLRSIAKALILGGMFGVFIGFSGTFLPFITDFLSNIFAKSGIGQQGMDMSVMQAWIVNFLGGFFKVFLTQGIVLVAAGVVFMVISCFFKSKSKSDIAQYKNGQPAPVQSSSKRNKKIVMSIRILVVITLIAAIPITINNAIKSFSEPISEFRTIMADSSKSMENVDFNEILIEVIGADFIKGLGGNGEGQE